MKMVQKVDLEPNRIHKAVGTNTTDMLLEHYKPTGSITDTLIDLKVKFLRDIEGMSLQGIADKLKYEVGYIKNVSCRNPKNG